MEEEHSAFSVLNFKSDVSSNRHMLVGSRDGYIRYFSDQSDDDDGYPMESYVYLPAVRLWDDWHAGKLTELTAEVAKDSGDVDWEVHVGASHQEAVNADAFASGTFSLEGRSFTARPRARGGSLVVKLENGDGKTWGVEQILATAVQGGRIRRL